MKTILADPLGSVLFDYWKTRDLVKFEKFEVEGVGKETIPSMLDVTLIDDCV